ncbi:acyloxyacyl hydrolase [Sediminicurvatus halobius]|uniref:Acyloxyacyl hydrolase n=1 Tax=Sediminicurvatus halobius TaxID=2182432 RepID=A0A2U2N047_9GAMM|nr:acyloxyacyl hydrolase [Spiribacter halobius]PWG62556.1 hypothetical protein DEM34_11430 [Spiribacter halobius]UEX78530.1 acyloxyacyl hydrolase [Spiribacter halobius]
MSIARSAIAALTLGASLSGVAGAAGWEVGGAVGGAFGEDAGIARLTVGQRLPAWQPTDAWPALAPRWEAGVDGWTPLNGTGGHTTAAVTVRAALAAPLTDDGRCYVEAGTGLMLIEDRTVVGDLDWGSALQFDSHLGVGLRLGAARQWTVAAEVHHASNGSLSEINPGMDFALLALRYGL